MATQSSNNIALFVKKVRAVAVRRVVVGASFVFILVAAAAFLATYAIEDSSDLSPRLVDSVRGVAVVLVALTAAWALAGWIRSRRTRFVGDRLRPSHRAFAGDLRSALEFSAHAREKDLDGFSTPLIDAHVRAVEFEADAVNVERLFPAPRYRLWAAILIPTLAACFFITGLGPQNAANVWLRLLGLAATREKHRRLLDRARRAWEALVALLSKLHDKTNSADNEAEKPPCAGPPSTRVSGGVVSGPLSGTQRRLRRPRRLWVAARQNRQRPSLVGASPQSMHVGALSADFAVGVD